MKETGVHDDVRLGTLLVEVCIFRLRDYRKCGHDNCNIFYSKHKALYTNLRYGQLGFSSQFSTGISMLAEGRRHN